MACNLFHATDGRKSGNMCGTVLLNVLSWTLFPLIILIFIPCILVSIVQEMRSGN
jgi:hypothetical protein